MKEKKTVLLLIKNYFSGIKNLLSAQWSENNAKSSRFMVKKSSGIGFLTRVSDSLRNLKPKESKPFNLP